MPENDPHTAELVDEGPDRRVGPREARPPLEPEHRQAEALSLLDECLADLERGYLVHNRLRVLRRLLQAL